MTFKEFMQQETLNFTLGVLKDKEAADPNHASKIKVVPRNRKPHRGFVSTLAHIRNQEKRDSTAKPALAQDQENQVAKKS
tara:strand:+ start:2639 stop:2878 length:240 start_codon:yes stop_codon:yes gene_type:complete